VQSRYKEYAEKHVEFEKTQASLLRSSL